MHVSLPDALITYLDRCGGCGKFGMVKITDYVKLEENEGFKETVTYTRTYAVYV